MELYHHGVPGMKWGVRRYQNPDGSLTSEGKKRYRQDAEQVRKNESEFREAIKEYKRNISQVKQTNDYSGVYKGYSEKKMAGEKFINSLIDLKKSYGEKNVSELSPDLIQMGRDYAMADYIRYHGGPNDWTKNSMSPEKKKALLDAERDYHRRGSPYS